MPCDLGGAGRLITLSNREIVCELINEAIANGARQKSACNLVGITNRTYQRWNQGEKLTEDKRLKNNAPVHNKLPEIIKYEVLRVVNLPEYESMTPHQIVPKLLDKGEYIASESSFYRIMRENNQLKHRGKSASASKKKPNSLKATGPNEVYSWDITYLLSPIKGLYFYLYMVMDIYSRKIVGWQVYDCESSAYAADLIDDICRREKILKNQLVIHSDNGGPMRGATLRAKMIDLCIDSSYSRPCVSNDNPYSESLFKTVKYHYTFPEKPFANLNDSRTWVDGFVYWYNDEHLHCSIKFVTPNQRHAGLDKNILKKRKETLEKFKKLHPERWNGRETRDLKPVNTVYLNPEKLDSNSYSGKSKAKIAP